MKETLNFLKSILSINDTIILGVSGGPDSMLLTNLLLSLKDYYNLNIIVAHVNHKLRMVSDDEALFVKNFCLENNLIYEYKEINDYLNNSIEAYARKVRYTFFEDLATKYNAKYIMTAHHGDDLIETIMMRLVRGSNLKGYSGIHRISNYKSYEIVRPLINLTKDDILTFMDKNNFKYVIDESNNSDTITRVRYRKYLLPFLKKEDKNVHEKFIKFSKELEETNNFIESYINKIMDRVIEDSNYKINELLKLDSFILKKVVECILACVYQDNIYLITDKHRDLILDLIKSKRSNKKINLPDGFIAEKNYNYLVLKRNIEKKEFFYVLESVVHLPNNMVIKKVKTSDSNSNYVIRLNSKSLKLPIIVRSKKQGDRMAVKNLNGTKKIKDILIDEKINIEDRSLVPVVVDSDNNILWLAGIKKSKFDVQINGMYDIILSYEEEN